MTGLLINFWFPQCSNLYYFKSQNNNLDMEKNNILTDKKVHNGNGNSDSISLTHNIEELLWWSSPEMYREALEALFEAWILSDNLPDGSERDSIYDHYKYLMQFLNGATV